MKVRTRFAPSPTGSMHIGGIRTALFAYALAKKHNGQFILRIEDTDQNRKVDGAVEEIYSVLNSYGLTPNESDIHGGDFGPYTQSKRLDLYKKYALELVNSGNAYYCFLTNTEIETLKKQSQQDKQAFRSPHRNLTPQEVQVKLSSNMPYVIRQKMPDVNQEIVMEDGVLGKLKFNSQDVDEGVLLKSDGFPTYHLAMLVDDHLMDITHVFRAMEWVSSIPRHVLLYQAMKWEMPLMYHLTAVLDPEGGKLSKRKGAVAASEFLLHGYLPEAVLNFLMLLGWSPKIERKFGESENEFYTLPEFVDLFDVDGLNKSNPVFNRTKLEWFNHQYILKLSLPDLVNTVTNWLKFALQSNLNDSYNKTILNLMVQDTSLESKLQLVHTRINYLSELAEILEFMYVAPTTIDWSIKQTAGMDLTLINQAKALIYNLHNGLDSDATKWEHATWEQEMRGIADSLQIKHGDCFMILRMFIVGLPFSPSLFEAMQLLGKQEVLKRLE